MRIGSLFAGIGGLELGLEAATGGRVVWQVEREEWPRRVLARRWPDADRSVTDVCEAGALNLAPVDLICGGFPCQDISPAGKGAGIAGAKSGLWTEFARVIREMGPRYVVVENSHLLPVRGLSTVLGDLAELGYDAAWRRLGAVDVGAPHRRWRCFVVAWRPDADCGRCVGERRANSNGRQDGANARRDKPNGRGAHLADADRIGCERQQRPRSAARTALGARARRPHGPDPVPSPAIRRVADGLPTWVGDGPVPRAIGGRDLGPDGRAALRALGNAVVPAVAYEVGRWLLEVSR